MTQIDRREVMRSMIALGAGACLSASALAAQRIGLPSGPMRLTRRLEREMSRAAQVIVTRDWSVQFAPQGAGFAVSGAQMSATVDAPEAVAAFAKLEEQRSTDGMFPILLSDNGMIVAAGAYVQENDEARAIRLAREAIAARMTTENAKADLLQALAILQSSFASLLEQMPADLFFPAGEPSRRVQALSLPGGITGEFELSYEARSAEQGDWLKQAERKVITRIGADERQAREVWSMTPL